MGTVLVLLGVLLFFGSVIALVLGLVSKATRRPIRFALRIPAALGMALLGMVVIAIGGAFMPASTEVAEVPQPEKEEAVTPAATPKPEPSPPTPVKQRQETQDSGQEAAEPAQAPWIKVKASPTGPFTVDAIITTNLPDDAILSTSLALADQGPDDTFIGTAFEKITVRDAKAGFVIDGTQRVSPMNATLPAGTYDVEVNFHPRWDENQAVAAELNIAESVEGVGQVQLGGSGESVADAKEKAELNDWVMMNVNMGDKWDEAYYIEKLGAYRELELESGNPEILKVYYFPKVDMTFIVNVYKGEITVWRQGEAHR